MSTMTRTAPRKTSAANPVSKTWSNRQKKANNLGLSSMDELRHYERIERGTSATRQRPRKHDLDSGDHAVFVGKDKQSFLSPLWEYIDHEIGSEFAFPKDGDKNILAQTGKQAGHVLDAGDTITVSLAGKEYPVRVVGCFEASTRLRYRIAFDNGAEMALTQAILLKIRVLPPVALAPTHLLPSVCPPVPVPVFSYHGATWTVASAIRVKERIAQHWQRQIGHMNFEWWAILV